MKVVMFITILCMPGLYYSLFWQLVSKFSLQYMKIMFNFIQIGSKFFSFCL
uniref:Uncharacterized protein n=1 Tax=Anguilla anguilla TaxID=7936 RepID=A0A0E9XZC2_ANGAN